MNNVVARWREFKAAFLDGASPETVAAHWRTFTVGYIDGSNAVAKCISPDKLAQMEALVDHAEQMYVVPDWPNGPPDDVT